MEFKGLRINIILLAIIVVILVFFTVNHLLKIYNIERPLQDRLKSFTEIEDFLLINSNGKIDLQITFRPDIDFYHLYREINQIAAEHLGSKKGKIIVENTDSKQLDQVYYQLQYALFEGMATSQFVTMEKNISRIVKANQLADYKLWIDHQALFLQLDDGKSSLYQRIPYHKPLTLNQAGGGSNG